MLAVENIVLQIGAALDEILDLLPVQIMTVVCAALSVVAFILQIFYIRACTGNIKNYRRIKRFVVRRGDIDLANSHRFYKKCVKHMPRSVRKAWKNHALVGAEYAGSELRQKMNKSLTAEKRPMMFYYYIAFSCVAALQTLLLCKGLQWTIAVCYTALAAAAWAGVGLVAKLYSYIRRRRNTSAAAGIMRILDNRLTLEDKTRTKVYFVSADRCDGIKKVSDVPKAEAAAKLADSVGAFVKECPDKEIAKVVENGLTSTACAATQNEQLKQATESLKKYTA